MEPFDIDNIIKNKLKESNDLHAHEMESAKPFVWSAIQRQIDSRKSLTWVHLAAAVVLLMISFSFILFSIQNGHRQEMEQISIKVDQLQKDYMTQAELLHVKNRQVESLDYELKNVEVQLTKLEDNKPLIQRETIIHQVDTVFIKQVEYITAIPAPKGEDEITMNIPVKASQQMETVEFQEMEVDDVIFPSSTNLAKNGQAESIQIKIGLFIARKN